MDSDWITYTLGELGPIKTGKTPPSSSGDGFGGTVPFVTPGDMNGQKWITDTGRHLNESGLTAVGSSLMPARSVAISCIGSDMGKAALLRKPSVTNQQINTIAVDESRFNAEFVYYDLSVRQQELKAAASGSATPILNKGHFSAFEISVPPRATQNKIAKILGSLDDKINLNRRINQTLEAMAQALFKSWFVNFDPVKAKIAAKQHWLAKHADSPLPLGEGLGVRALTPFARENRQNATNAEMLMWRLLRGKQLGAKFRRQHPVGSYILDFYCHDHRLAIELDGSQHYLPQGMAADEERSQMLAVHGIRVLRFSNRDVLLETEGVMERVWQAIALTPTPLPEGEGLQAAMQRAAMSAISGMGDAELNALKLLPSPSGRGAGGEGSLYDQLAATAALFPDEMEESELGEIPRGWETQRIGKLLELAYGKALKSNDRKEGVVPVYGSGGVTGYHNVPLVPNGSIVIGRKGTVGSLYWEDKPFFPIDTTYYVRPITVPLTYCYYAMQTLGLEKMNTDAAVPGLNRENVYRLELVRPDSAVLHKFDSEVSALRNAIRVNTDANKVLANLRDTLLPKLLSGELSVVQYPSELKSTP